ncbi:GxxExxY protein [Parerythrobacter lacustris]|uniref:GxxExxY protein n=1 Tax=Parerythrobacter lacustris TaxID=2969984 RepID=A0ABT1XNK9_9SPHN|nr:GxxExxY protein [Parerythrobacter lacustris]MCR2833248.1 GxxExxY protein [Parerythrobacter lacustris]
MLRDDELERVAAIVIDCGFHLHRDLGPGLLESAYEQLMYTELAARGLSVARQVPVTLRHRSVVVDNAFKIDLLVESRLVVELKSVERLTAVHGKQVLTYLRVMQLPLGLLMNFGEATLKSGLRRIANDYHAH